MPRVFAKENGMLSFPPHLVVSERDSQALMMLLAPWKLVSSFPRAGWRVSQRGQESIFGGQPWGCLEER